MKKMILTVCFAITALTTLAQSPLSFHAKAGIGTSSFYGKHSGSETRMAYKAGVGAAYELNKTWVLQSALEFVSIGGERDLDYIGQAKMNELYLQIPIMMNARLHLGKDYHASLSVGPYVALGVGGKTTGERYDYSSSHPSSDNYRFRMDTFGSLVDGNMGNNRFDAGISMGISFEYHRFMIGAEAQVGLITVNKQLNQVINPDGYGEDFLPKNLASFFTVGYRFW